MGEKELKFSLSLLDFLRKKLVSTKRNANYVIFLPLYLCFPPQIYAGFFLMQGTPFADICELTDVPEGLIVRTIVRLDETCREFRNAAAIMGNSALHKKMEIASNAIKRDIVFAASLYITGV